MKKKQKKLVWIVVGGLFLAVLFQAFRTDITVVDYELTHPNIDSTIAVALIADLHSCDYGDGQQEIMDALSLQKPDIVLLSGDIVDDVLPQDKAKEFLDAVSKRYPTYYVTGNHEVWSGEVDKIKVMVADYGITVLEGNCVPVEIKGQTINICGVDDPESGELAFTQQLEQCNENLSDDIFSILMTHRPERVEIYQQYDFDLVVAGHAHGGQWRIPFILNGLLAPNQGFFPKYAGGLYQFDDQAMVVSRGLAKESTRIPRIFNRPEIVMITLSPEMVDGG